MSWSIIYCLLRLCGVSAALWGCRGRSEFNQRLPESFRDTGLFMTSGSIRYAVQEDLTSEVERKWFQPPRPPSGKDFFPSPGEINIYIPALSVLIEIKLNSSLRVRQQFRWLIPYIPILLCGSQRASSTVLWAGLRTDDILEEHCY